MIEELKVNICLTLDVDSGLNKKDLNKYILDNLILKSHPFIEVVKAEITRKVGTIGNRDFDYLQKSAFEAAAKEIVLSKNGISDWSNDFIKPLANEILTKRIEKAVAGIDWQKTVDTLAKEKVKSLIQ